MGVLGLWQILESVGHPIKVEGLEGKRLGVDANVWLYKFIRGFREKETGTSLESHKLGLFNRVSKLLFYKIKPVFVFDGPAPTLKRRTLERRQNIRVKNLSKVQDAAMRALAEQLKKQYPNADLDDIRIQLPEFRSNGLVAAEKLTNEDRELFSLPPEEPKQEHDSDESESDEDIKFVQYDHRRVDIESKDFESLPPEIRYEILHDVKSRKRISNPEALPEDPNSFSSFQLKRLNARRNIQAKIEKCERDICSEVSPLVIQYEGQKNPEFDLHKREPFRDDDIKPPFEPSSSSSSSTFRPVSRSEFIDPPPQPKKEPVIDFELDDESSSSSSGSMIEINPPALSAVGSESEGEPEVVEDSDSSSSTEMASQATHNESQTSNKSLTATMSETINLDASENPEASISSSQDERSFLSPSHSPSPTKKNQTICISDSSDGSDIEELNPTTISSIKRPSPVKSPLAGPPAKRRSLSPSQKTIEDTDTPVIEPSQPEPPKTQDSPPEAADARFSPPTSSSPPPPPSEPTQAPLEQVAPPATVSEEITFTPSPPPAVQAAEEQPIPPATTATTSTTTTTTTTSTSSSQPIQYSQSQSSGVSHTTAAASKRVTTKIVEEAKELLTLFGIPYIDAAGEAEAQCALLEKLDLTEGTITDDSDVWLFGAQNVYRHFFSDDKYVLQYKLKDIEFHLRLSRENMVCFAMLVGSDYTDGIMNVGPVTALEILSEFPGPNLDPLIKFKQWRDSLTSGSRPGNIKRRKLLKYNIPDEFPSRAVFEGYMKPAADTSSEKFTWGMPDLDELRDYARRNFGWDLKKIDDKLLPVMKKLNERRTQTTIDTFFFKTSANQNPELFRSKRINEALSKIAKRDDEVVCLSEDEDDNQDLEGNSQKAAKSKAGAAKKTTARGANGNKKKKPAATAKSTASRGRRRKS